MRIVVLTKPVPDPASGGERLGADGRLDRANSPAVVNGNDEYVLEKALKLVEAAGEGEVILLTMAPANGARDDAQGAGDGRDARRPRDRSAARRLLHRRDDPDPRRGAQDARVRPRARRRRHVRRRGGVVAPGVAALAGLPYLSYAATIEPDAAAGTVRVNRITPSGYDVLEAPMPALISGTQALGEPRYPSLKGIMAARNKEITTLTLADLGIDPATVGTAGATTKVVDSRAPEPRAATRVVREEPDEAARQVVALLAERRLI